MENDSQTLINMKFLLYCLQWLTGLRINYHKCEVVIFGMSSEQQQIANFMNCKVGNLPMTYLGLPISDKHLGAKTSADVENKMRRKLSNWKGKMLSAGGKLILTNSTLSSIPTYTMGMYKLGEEVYHKMEYIIS